MGHTAKPVRTTVKDTIIGEYGSQVARNSAGTLTPGALADLKEAPAWMIEHSEWMARTATMPPGRRFSSTECTS
jgi:hypothetical protein